MQYLRTHNISPKEKLDIAQSALCYHNSNLTHRPNSHPYAAIAETDSFHVIARSDTLPPYHQAKREINRNSTR